MPMPQDSRHELASIGTLGRFGPRVDESTQVQVLLGNCATEPQVVKPVSSRACRPKVGVTRARSTDQTPGSRSPDTGSGTARATPGRLDRRRVPIPTRKGPMPVGRCCASSSNRQTHRTVKRHDRHWRGADPYGQQARQDSRPVRPPAHASADSPGASRCRSDKARRAPRTRHGIARASLDQQSGLRLASVSDQPNAP